MLKLILFIAICTVSLVMVFAKNSNEVFLWQGNKAIISGSNLDFYNSNGNFVFSIVGSQTDKPSFFEQFGLSARDLILNRKSFIWNNLPKYTINSDPKKIQVIIDGQEEVIKFCSNCLVADDRHRVYFNADSITAQTVDIPSKLNLIKVVVGENQNLPLDASKILILSSNWEKQAEIPIKNQVSQIFLDSKSNTLKFKFYVREGQKANARQDIYIQN